MRRYGATFETVSSSYAEIITALQWLAMKLPGVRPTGRIVYQWDDPDAYIEPCKALAPLCDLMLLVCDSSSLKHREASQINRMTNLLVKRLGPYLKSLEIGNEVNGDWVGRQKDIPAKIDAVSKVALNSRLERVLTLYLGEDVQQMLDWDAAHDIPREVTALSWYPYQQSVPTARPGWNSLASVLVNRRPATKLMIGEYGTESTDADGNEVNLATPAERAALIAEVEGLVVQPSFNWIGGGFYWDWQTDMTSGAGAQWGLQTYAEAWK